MFTNFSKPGNDAPNTPAQASARRFSDFHNARHPRVVTTVARTTRSICALGLPCGLAARGCCVRLEGRPPRIRAYSAARKTAYQTCRTHRSRDLEACVACSSLPLSLSLSLSRSFSISKARDAETPLEIKSNYPVLLGLNKVFFPYL